MKSNAVFALCLVTALFGSCSNDQKKPVSINTPLVNKQKLTGPFRFHKAIEVRPGLTLDVLSWGRGSDSVGAYLILRSDSTHLKYKSVSGELAGKIADAWSMDADSDGNPELFIQAQGKGSAMNMYVYEFTDGSAQELRFPALNKAMQEEYRGQDFIYIKNGKLMREFPVFDDQDPGRQPTSDKRTIEYRLINNSFVAAELRK